MPPLAPETISITQLRQEQLLRDLNLYEIGQLAMNAERRRMAMVLKSQLAAVSIQATL